MPQLKITREMINDFGPYRREYLFQSVHVQEVAFPKLHDSQILDPTQVPTRSMKHVDFVSGRDKSPNEM